MRKLMLQITAGVLQCMVRIQRDYEHSDKCFYQAIQDKLEASMVMPVRQSTAKANMMKLALDLTMEVIV